MENAIEGFENDNPSSRKQKLLQKMGTLHLDITEIPEKKGVPKVTEKKDFNYIFAGIKLYPPLGYDPWPAKNEEREKVKLLYHKCLEKNNQPWNLRLQQSSPLTMRKLPANC
jgi:hypothetical protein